jgi:L-ascorbate metabolism protein UlaG (beta-lactamase superfamily)
MKLLKADNYQTWLIEEADIAVLIDPWLSKQLQPDNSIFIQRKKSQASLLNDEDYEKVQAIIITAPFEDHLHIESIKSFPKSVKIYTSKFIKRLLLRAGVANDIYIINEDGVDIGSINIRTLPTGFPYHPATIALLIEDSKGNRIFHEGHIARFKYLMKNNIKADVAILTAEEVKLFGFLRLGMDYKRTLKACDILGAKELFITGSNPEKTTGFISKFLLIRSIEREKIQAKINLHDQAGNFINLD